jgi:predicted permease
VGNVLVTVLPVFLVVAAGYVAVWRGYFAAAAVDGLMAFAQKVAIPCLLFTAIATLDLGAGFDLGLLFSFYTGSTACFALGILGARLLFGRPWVDSVVIGFAALYANLVLLGLAIGERAYGVDSLGPQFAIVALHAPFCYLLGILTMEVLRAEAGGVALARKVTRAMVGNPIMIGIGLGFAVNLSGLPLPAVAADALALMVRAALPAALFGLGGVLYRYRPEGDAGVIALICGLSLILHPAIALTLGQTAGALTEGQLRAAVLSAAMAPGVNAYLFADMYGAARRVVASSILIGTGLSVLSVPAWIWLVG